MLEGGDWLFGLGEKVDCRKDPASCLKLTVQLSKDYSPICDAACAAFGHLHETCTPIWHSSREGGSPSLTSNNATTMSKHIGGAEFAACKETCQTQKDWRWNMVDCLKDVVLEPHNLCVKVDTLCRNPFE